MSNMTSVTGYDVRLAEHLATAILHWTPMQQGGFIKEADALASSPATRSLRLHGGTAIWPIVGDYHMTYRVDADEHIITVTAARPCIHREGACLS